MSSSERVVLLIDLDCFYCQVEENLNPSLKGKPVAVLQYNVWREGGIIAANYAARKFGVTKGMWRKEAEDKCPDIQFARVPELRGKADLTRYREAGKKVADVIKTFTTFLERASVDESYLDVTNLVTKHIDSCSAEISLSDIPNTHIVGCETKDFLDHIYDNREVSLSDLKLIVGALICEQIRAKVYLETGYECSAGIAHNKLLAKLVSSLHKPNKQTVLPQSNIVDFLKDFPIKKMKNLGGKFGKILSEELNISVIGELAKYTEKDLIRKFDDKTGKWLYSIARGIDLTPVNPHFLSNSIACSKRFPGKNSLKSLNEIEYWIKEIALDLSERLQKDFEENNRKGTQMVVSCCNEIDEKDYSHSKTLPLVSYEFNKIAQKAMDTIKSIIMKKNNSICVKLLSINACNFESVKNIQTIKLLFENLNSSKTVQENKNLKEKFEADETNDDVPCDISATEASVNFENKCTLENSCIENKSNNTNIIISSTLTSSEKKRESENICDDTSNKKKQTSFFMAYFEKRAQQQQQQQQQQQHNEKTNTAECNLATSECPILNDSGENDVIHNKIENANNSSELAKSDGIVDEIDINRHKTCPECNEILLEADYFVHMDYHYALKINSHNEEGNCMPLEDTQELSVKSTKELNPLDMFLQKEPLLQESELCSQCNKKIKLCDLDSHIDYHAAKKLHLEINTVNKRPPSKIKKSKDNASVKKISAFFKPVKL